MRHRIRSRNGAQRPHLTIPQILAWADAHQERTGNWPNLHTGLVRGTLNEKWRNVDGALRIGLRGLEGGSSLARLLCERRGVRNQKDLPRVPIAQMLAWADAHRQRTGTWPTSESGPISDVPGENWRGVDQALRLGLRGQPGGSSLAQLLAEQRGVRNLQSLPKLTTRQILTWAEAHHQRTGAWPDSTSGPVREAPGESWKGITSALLLGRRGLPGRSSLARLLAARKGVRNPKQLPTLNVKQILAWARAHRRRTGQWPTRDSGPVVGARGETWSAVHAALSMGGRGLAGGTTLAALIASHKVVPRESSRPRLTIAQILAWAEAHHRRTGAWPHARSGPIAEAPGETWRAVDHALHQSLRGLQSGMTLVELLTRERGVRTRQYTPPLSEGPILAWAREYHQRTGSWPSYRSGPIADSGGETWRSVDTALRQGTRGLKGRSSLAQLIAREHGIRNRTNLPSMQVKEIITWAVRHFERTGRWPHARSGPIPEAPGETWKGVDMAMRGGYRGLQAGCTLAQLLALQRKVRNRANLPQLTHARILAWADAHYHRTGTWPTRQSGSIVDAPGETWSGVELALRRGHRGLPGGSSVGQLLHRYRKV